MRKVKKGKKMTKLKTMWACYDPEWEAIIGQVCNTRRELLDEIRADKAVTFNSRLKQNYDVCQVVKVFIEVPKGGKKK